MPFKIAYKVKFFLKKVINIFSKNIWKRRTVTTSPNVLFPLTPNVFIYTNQGNYLNNYLNNLAITNIFTH